MRLHNSFLLLACIAVFLLLPPPAAAACSSAVRRFPVVLSSLCALEALTAVELFSSRCETRHQE